MDFIDIGLIPYNEAWNLQEDLHLKRVNGEIPDTMLLLEHPPVFTLGKRDCDDDILSGSELIAKDGIEIVKANRGGRVTYHGPGQLVCYFICSISSSCIKNFVYLLEDICIHTLAKFGIEGVRDSEYPGVWVDQNKIAAIGLHVSHGVTQHGFALNVNCNLNHYRHILPCGINGRGITSIEKILGRAPSIDEVKRIVTDYARLKATSATLLSSGISI